MKGELIIDEDEPGPYLCMDDGMDELKNNELITLRVRRTREKQSV